MGNFRSNASGGRGGFGGGRPRSGGGFGGGSRSGGFGGGRSFGSSRGGFGERRGPMEMHDATCSKCAKACQVPFKPTGNKPVLCSDCFRNSGDPRGNARDFSSRGPGNAGSNSNAGVTAEQFSKINGKLDKIIKILEELEVIPEEEVEVEDLDEEESEENSGNLINDSSDDEDDDDEDFEEAPKSA